MRSEPDPQFTQGVANNLTYWRTYLHTHPDKASFILEHPNLAQAVQFGLSFPDTLMAAASLAIEVYPLIERHGYWHTWQRLLHQILARWTNEHTALIKAKLLNILGQLYRRTQQLKRALAVHEEAASMAHELSNPEAIVEAQFNLSEDYRQLGDYEKAEALGLTTLANANNLPGGEKWRASLLNTLGLVAWNQEDLTSAQAYLETAVSLWRGVENQAELARTLNNLGTVLAAQKQTELALAIFSECIDVLRATPYELDKSRVQISLGTLYFNQKQFAQAESAFRQANTTALKQSGDDTLRGIQAQNLGNSLLHLGRYTEAERYLRQSLALWKGVNNKLMMINTMGTLAETLAMLQEETAARKLYDEALTMLIGLDNAMAKRLKKEYTQKRALLKTH